jgi:hypothetical protein
MKNPNKSIELTRGSLALFSSLVILNTLLKTSLVVYPRATHAKRWATKASP